MTEEKKPPIRRVRQHRGVLLPETTIGPPRSDGPISCGSCFWFSSIGDETDFKPGIKLDAQRIQAIQDALAAQGMKFEKPTDYEDLAVVGRFELGCGLCMMRPAEGTGRSSHVVTHWSWRCAGHTNIAT